MDTFHGIETLSPSDQILFNRFGRGPSIEVPFSLIHEAIESFVDRQPLAIAADHDGNKISYQELDNAANLLANSLIASGLKTRQRVCLVVQRSISMVVALFAVLKCGCQYVPLDGGIVPDDTLRHILTDTSATHILCQGNFTKRVTYFANSSCGVIVLDGGSEDARGGSMDRPAVEISPYDGAYMIYTSGTTGRPKGVDVSHSSATNLLSLYPGNLGIKPGTNVAQCLSISFDMGQWEILSTLMNGGTLLLRTSDWPATLKRAHTVILTPSILQKYKRSDYPNIKVAVVGGEPCPKMLADEWSDGAVFINCCGPTEVSILNTMLEYSPSRPLSIGKPVPNTNVYILDENENPLSIGATGIMWVGGRCVSRGYLNLPELTSKRYKLDKFASDGSRMFNTGDLVRWLDDGNLDHKGRRDDQVKIKGFRVELDSISWVIEKTPGIVRACTIFQDEILLGFYSGSFVDEATIKEAVGKYLPYYAVPSRWEYRPRLPLTLNGKVDKRILLESVKTKSESKTESVLNRESSGYPKAEMKIVPTQARAEQSIIHLKMSPKSSKPIRNSWSSITLDSLQENGTTINVQTLPVKGIEDLESLKAYPLPEMAGIHGLSVLRFKVFSLYRRFFTTVVVANIAITIWLIRSRGETLTKLATATAANITVAVLMRQDHVVNALFKIFCSVPTWAPLFMRRNFAQIFHIGGIHSGAAVASTVWFVIFSFSATLKFDVGNIVVISWIIVALLVSIMVTSYPSFRKHFHDHFELIHRFGGWTALSLFWMQTVLIADATRGDVTLGHDLAQSPGFWMLIIATSSIILPWLTLRKVSVRADVLSHRAVRLYFNYTTPVIGAGVRLSLNPLLEWHAFAAIPKPEEKGFSLLVSKAGDWTTQMINSPPTLIWVRGVPACGVLRIATLFKSIILVATGSGIGPCLPLIYARQPPIRVLWSTPSPEQTFGQEIIRAIKVADENAIIHNTKTQGRPDLVALSYRLYRESGAEAICVISNQEVTQLVVYEMESRGIPAFGAIFDS